MKTECRACEQGLEGEESGIDKGRLHEAATLQASAHVIFRPGAPTTPLLDRLAMAAAGRGRR